MTHSFSVMSSGDSINNAGEFSRLKSQLGIRASGAPIVSSYIVQQKLRKAILEYSRAQMSVKEYQSGDRLVTKLDKFTDRELKYLLFILEEDGIEAALVKIKQPQSKTRRESAAHQEMLKEYEMQTTQFEDAPIGDDGVVPEGLFPQFEELEMLDSSSEEE